MPDLGKVGKSPVPDLGIREVEVSDHAEAQVAEAGPRNDRVRQIDRFEMLAILEDRQAGIGNPRTPQNNGPQVRQLDHGRQVGIADGDVGKINCGHGEQEFIRPDRFRLKFASGELERLSGLDFFTGHLLPIHAASQQARGAATPGIAQAARAWPVETCRAVQRRLPV